MGLSFQRKDIVIWWMASIWLIVDTITGLFISYGTPMPLSQIFKFIILILIIDRLTHKSSILILTGFICIYLSFYILYLIINSKNFVEPILILSKFLSLIYLYLYFRFTCKIYPKQFIRYSKIVFVLGGIIISINVLLGVLGYGIPTYKTEGSEGLGIKGFFFAGNELGGVMAIIVPVMIYIIIKNLHGIKLYGTFIAIVLTGVLIGTKASIISTLLSAIIIPVIYAPPKRRKILVLSVLIIGIALVLIIKEFIDNASIDAINRWTFFYNNGGLTRLLFSGRDEFWEDKKLLFFNSSVFTQLFGLGVEDDKIVERDHLDAILIFGYIGGICIVSFFAYLLLNAIKSRQNNSLVKTIVFSDILIIGIGYIAGHVWFSAMASVYIALLNSFTSLRCRRIIFSEKIGGV